MNTAIARAGRDWLEPSFACGSHPAGASGGEMRHPAETRTALLFMCHQTDAATFAEFHKIARALEVAGTTYILFHQKGRTPPAEWMGEHLFPFTEESMAALPYPPIGDAVIPGSAHFPVLDFFKQHPDYEHYWLVEYDVRFSGDWQVFFESFHERNEDFLSCHIRRYADEPRWSWWWCLAHPERTVPFPDRLRSFNPIYRISNAALMHLDLLQREGWWGHFEVLIPTLLHQGGFRIADVGGMGEFVVQGDENKFYREGTPDITGALKSGTMRWRPAFAKAGPETNKLYHPVKPRKPDTVNAPNRSSW